MSTPVHRPGKGSHLRRISVIALHAFTQLARMKVFYFLGVFAVIAIASNFLDLSQHEGPEAIGANVLRLIKSWSLGAMTLFSVTLSVVATALLLPKDVEDRTLYTILAKPVPRFDYLAGKLAGVLLLVFVSLFLMDLLATGVLQVRTSMVVEEQTALAVSRGLSPEGIREEVLAHGPSWSLQAGILAVFLRSAVIASMALLISTFSTSTLFTTIISFLVYFIGYFQADARAAFFSGEQAGQGMAERVVGLAVSLVLPDFQLFNVIDGVIQGQFFPPAVLGKLVIVTSFHVLVYTFASWFIFAKKEF